MFVKTGFFLFAVISVLVTADNFNITNQNVEPQVGFFPQPPNVTDGPSNTTTTTSRPTTTTKITTTTANPNTTTTAAPITTTPTSPNTTTTTAPITTTPSSPNTTTTSPITTTPKPDNTLSVNSYTGNYTNSTNICLMAKLAIQIEILNNKENSTFINVPKNVSYTVTCAPNSSLAYLTINFKENDSVNFQFFRNNSKYEIQSINTTLLVNGQNTTTNLYHQKPEFSISEKLSYYCKRDQALNLTNGVSNETLAKIHFSDVQYQAFMNSTNAHYSSVWDCDGVNTPDIVPVVVGCVLAILVVLVLVVYLFGRRRCQARGYLSM